MKEKILEMISKIDKKKAIVLIVKIVIVFIVGLLFLKYYKDQTLLLAEKTVDVVLTKGFMQLVLIYALIMGILFVRKPKDIFKLIVAMSMYYVIFCGFKNILLNDTYKTGLNNSIEFNASLNMKLVLLYSLICMVIIVFAKSLLAKSTGVSIIVLFVIISFSIPIITTRYDNYGPGCEFGGMMTTDYVYKGTHINQYNFYGYNIHNKYTKNGDKNGY